MTDTASLINALRNHASTSAGNNQHRCATLMEAAAGQLERMQAELDTLRERLDKQAELLTRHAKKDRATT